MTQMTEVPQEETLDLAPLDEILDRYRGQKGAVIPILQQTQEVFGYLPRPVLEAISKKTRVPLSDLYGVATFYAQFYLTRRGKHIIRSCDGTACHVRGASKIIDKMVHELGIQPGETTPDYKFTYEVVYCLGSCGLAPVAVIDDKVIGQMKPDKFVSYVRELD
jgi:NADH-quinone oxidoreductase subunit E